MSSSQQQQDAEEQKKVSANWQHYCAWTTQREQYNVLRKSMSAAKARNVLAIIEAAIRAS